jgi:hypothetical protein
VIKLATLVGRRGEAIAPVGDPFSGAVRRVVLLLNARVEERPIEVSETVEADEDQFCI